LSVAIETFPSNPLAPGQRCAILFFRERPGPQYIVISAWDTSVGGLEKVGREREAEDERRALARAGSPRQYVATSIHRDRTPNPTTAEVVRKLETLTGLEW
jgi:hypothetical protein